MKLKTSKKEEPPPLPLPPLGIEISFIFIYQKTNFLNIENILIRFIPER